MKETLLQTSNNLNKKVCKVKFFPFDITIDVSHGSTILEAARKAELPVKASCGGKGTCGECRVKIVEGSYKKITSPGLSEKLSQNGYTLTCITEIQDDLIVQLPAFQQFSIKSVTDAEYFTLYKSTSHSIFELNPIVKKIELQIPEPTSESNYSDFKRLTRELGKKYNIKNIKCELKALTNMQNIIRENSGSVTAVLIEEDGSQTVIDIKAGFKNKIYGIACDIGTTTVALKLIDLENGEIIDTLTSLNLQIKCGEDIISRIYYAEKPGHLKELNKLIIETINNLIEKIISEKNISYNDIYYGSFSGNTTMIHLLLEIDPQYIRLAPYIPAFNKLPFISAGKTGIKMNEEGYIYCAPAVGSYVGGDITAGLLCTPMIKETGSISLFIDLGTNGEIILGNHDWKIACACSAGPAFEGRGIKCGMQASEGAIESISLRSNGSSAYKVIENTLPKGLCGSGLIDILAELFSNGFIDRYGKFVSEKVQNWLIETDSGFGFIIEKPDNCFWENEIVITENDIKNLITTKAAVYAACSLLLKKVGITFDQIDKFYIAGGFGKFLNIENAIKTGFLPDIPREKYSYLGNSSLLGAHLILASDKNRELVEAVADKITYLELNTEPNYMNEFTGALFLPHTDSRLFPSVK